MDSAAIMSHLSGEQPPLSTLAFLSDEFIPAVIEEMNKPATRRRMALYGGDRIPENERNLTDVRNRMSLLIEYKLAWISNNILEANGISDLFWTNVVANRFPDLEIRTARGSRGLRIIIMTDKYQWSDNIVNHGRLSRTSSGTKPKHLVRHLSGN